MVYLMSEDSYLSFYVAGVGDLTEQELKAGFQAEKAVMVTLELGESQHRYAEVFFRSQGEAARAYREVRSIQGQDLRLLLKKSHSVVWLSGLPPVLSARDLFTTLQELTPGLLSVSVPRNPEVPGISSLGVTVLVYANREAAEEGLKTLRTPTKLYTLSYKALVNKDVRVLEAEPFVDLRRELQLETRHVIISRLPVYVSVKQLEQELSCFGQLMRLRKYATWAVATMRTVAEAKALIACRQLLVDGRAWDLRAGCRLQEDPQPPDLYSHVKRLTPRTSTSSSFNSNQPAYEISVLQLSIPDRQRLYEVVQSGQAFPCKKDALVKGFSLDLVNKARKLLQDSRKPVQSDPEPAAAKRPRFSGGPEYNYNTYQPEMQTLSDEQKLQYFYALNSKQGYPPPYYR